MTSTKTVVHEVPSRGYQTRTAFLDTATGHVLCYRAGGIRYARPLDPHQRWQRARPLADVRYGTRAHPTDCTGVAAECPQPGGRAILKVREDCLELNIWIPAGEPPAEGWPVFFYIHGGFLQWGSPNFENPAALLSETTFRAVIVAPSYRLNAFGFLASTAFRAVDQRIASNVGFWDQRLALEWTFANIAEYGGNPSNITVGGLSAGAYSTFHQLAYDALRAPKDRQLIRRVVMWSNGCGLPPKTEAEFQSHVALLLQALDIPTNLSAKAQLERLRAVSAEAIAEAVEKLPENAFRVVTDTSEQGAFVGTDLFADLRSGKLALRLKDRDIKLFLGEVRDEVNSYRLNSPPSSYDGLVRRLAIEYPSEVAARMAAIYCESKQTLPKRYKSWQDLFGRVYSDMQVHVSQRGFLSCLHPILPASHIYRYRICWRPTCVDVHVPKTMAVSHGTDMSVWWFGNQWGKGLQDYEKDTARQMVEPLGKFMAGEQDIGWGTYRIEQIRVVHEDGTTIDIREDPRWTAGCQMWREAASGKESRL